MTYESLTCSTKGCYNIAIYKHEGMQICLCEECKNKTFPKSKNFLYINPKQM